MTITAAVRGQPIWISSAEAICEALDYDLHDIFTVEEVKVPLSAKTVLEHHRLISTILHQAEKEMLVQFNMKENYDEVKVRMPKGQKDIIKAHADKHDGGSVNAFINRAITNQMELDNTPDTTPTE